MIRHFFTGVAIALCELLVGCRSREISTPRQTEPRLSGFDEWRPCTAKPLEHDHVVEPPDCGAANLPREMGSLTESECDDDMNTAADAVRRLAYYPQCTDAAIEKLESLDSRDSDGRFLSDLAAAYYVRAERRDRPSDFVRALDAADRAIAREPASFAARFNRALAQEALGFIEGAIESWDRVRKEPSKWGAESEGHYQRLLSVKNRAKAQKWDDNKERLPLAAETNDQKAVRNFVAPHYTAARHYLEEDVLPAWASAFQRGDKAEAETQLRLAGMIATALQDTTGDPYLLDVVDAIRRSPAPARLASAHLAFSAARKLELAFSPSAVKAYANAERALSGAESPMHLGAMMGRGTVLTQNRQYDDAFALFRAVEAEAARRHYPDLVARVHGARGYQLMTRGYDIDALHEYSIAQSQFDAAQDFENVGVAQTNVVGLLRLIGDQNLTWRESYVSERYLPSLVDATNRHTYYGENALAAVELGYPAVALQYQNVAVRMLEDNLSHPAIGADIGKLRYNLGVALRTRAGIYARLDDGLAAARADLAASTPLLGAVKGPIESIPNAFNARLAAASARDLQDRNAAIAKLTQAIDLASSTYYQTLTASLRLQRAELYRLDGNRLAAEEDLRRAIATLRDEEKTALNHPADRGNQVERLWSAYFSRPQEAYRQLIRARIEDGARDEAFDFAEKARAYEPLHLVLQRKDLPAEFRTRIHDGEPMRLQDIKDILPDGTFLLEYSVMNDRTYVWIVGRGFSDMKEIGVGEKTIRTWTRDLQRFAERKSSRFDVALAAPYALLRVPLTIVPKNARLVIIPDRSMHGLPYAALRGGTGYLIQEHAVSVAASATLYTYSLMRDRQLPRHVPQSVLLVGDPDFDRRLEVAHDLPALTGARNEVAHIGEVYRGAAHVDPPSIGPDATVPAFLRGAQNNTIIHLAAHGVANPDVPSRSFFLMAPSENDTGVIDAERLLEKLQLTQTRLSVLSACSSAGGTPVGPEGLAPLVRPFVAAGVSAVLGTLWNVSDSVATEDLLLRFHQHYRDSRNADEALQLAQQEMIAHPSKAHHAAWGWSAFQLYGCASSPFPAPAELERTSQ